MMLSKPAVLSFIAASLLGQTTSPAQTNPVELKRTTPPRTFVDTFDFDSNVKALQQTQPVDIERPVAGSSEGPRPGSSPLVPKGYKPPADVALSSTAQQAVQFSASWRAQQNAAAPGPDGRVLLAFGAGLPTVFARRSVSVLLNCSRAKSWKANRRSAIQFVGIFRLPPTAKARRAPLSLCLSPKCLAWTRTFLSRPIAGPTMSGWSPKPKTTCRAWRSSTTTMTGARSGRSTLRNRSAKS